ncbi:Gfo/Idh/MocA family protein [Caldivirga maquilingensis]|uniref:Oxidoreductase domain protein n=1 Tax=Caldivirga maquilingensis (strain ATCC 700844 / DSM 13496 / JCM 10307 / IC-167) TaxID=397948 RepID=A8ME11_CALMQ|nr:Gfo/Idh/MocA family oxidoreductase [Caldivirga maquilingensis]ABW02017.1 oxidoreductase domain protein [Caldivirga maquilingensis IC-167]
MGLSGQVKVRVGLIGAGGIANVHARYYRELPNVELVGVAEVVKERGVEFAKRWNIPEGNVFTDYREMIDKLNLDAVSITTPHRFHAEPTIYALKHGVNVLVEKPMASTAGEALEMYRAAASSGKILEVGFQNRFEAQIIAAKRIVAGGLLGEFYYGETLADGRRRRGIPTTPTFYTREMAGGGVLLDLGCYAIDNAMNILGFPEVVSVSGHVFTAIGRSRDAIVEGGWGAWDTEKFEVEDFVVAKIVLRNGGVLMLKEAWAMHNNELGRPFYMGTRGGIKLNPLEVYRDEWGHMTTTTVQLPNRDAWRDKIGKFIDAVINGKPSPIDPRENVYEQFILEAIYESARQNGAEVKLTIPDEVKPILNQYTKGA